ncbi:DUF2891 domain-containing protein [Aurantiacibacter spongiae]|uniref:DUF2891 domain-containing protein n=1 Tax=Aurantiacibacter spongiae TaxID=2488860 RepID=A0A3N5D923_9SPHN|nr:DUF2891 domain-containing protein [Aurantiacibacter spongiae]RPF71088.1 DUF2891 domain-containing protein [Aurantiacibacter spongiae]
MLDEAFAGRLARTALSHVAREYPNSIAHVMQGDADALTPRQMHPAFFGSFDWHSCVHSWWTLLTLRRLFPDSPEAASIAALADRTFTAGNLEGELAYFTRPEGGGFERPYGWAWFLALHAEAARHADRDWADRLAPMARHLAAGFRPYLTKLAFPIYTGTHFNTAFALVLAHDWGREHDGPLADAIAAYAEDAFGPVTDYRGWEPGGDEFLSPILTATLLMSRVRDQGGFARWFDGALGNGWLVETCQPVSVTDPADGKMAHLDGLNLSRAWCLRAIAAGLPDHGEAVQRIADRHFAASIGAVDGHYMGSHWLASFALLALLASPEA